MHTYHQTGRRAGWWLAVAVVLVASMCGVVSPDAQASKGHVVLAHPTRSELAPSPQAQGLSSRRVHAAVTGYHVYGTENVGLRERKGAGTTYKTIRILPEGTGVDIACQDYGQAVNGSDVWDHLSDGGWVTDYYISTPNYNAFSPGLPRCSQPSPPPPGVGAREQHAIDWARAQIGQTLQPNGKPWNGWCDRFVANAFGKTNSGYATAYKHWLDLANRGLVHPGDTNVPPGALAFYQNYYGGHVMVSEGGGRFVSTGTQVYETSLNSGFGAYLGWSYANPEWPGR